MVEINDMVDIRFKSFFNEYEIYTNKSLILLSTNCGLRVWPYIKPILSTGMRDSMFS